MNPNAVVRHLLPHADLTALLKARGVLLDEWDQRLTLAELCQEYQLDLRELLRLVGGPVTGRPD